MKARGHQYTYAQLRYRLAEEPMHWAIVNTYASINSARVSVSLMRRRKAWAGYELRTLGTEVQARFVVSES